jgi:hypothetical protein
MAYQYSHDEIQETAEKCFSRRKLAKEISKDVFIECVGQKLWNSFERECVDLTNAVEGFYSSGQQCLFVSVGNIDRVFIPLSNHSEPSKVMIQAKPIDFKFGALLQTKENNHKVRVLNNVRGDEFDATNGSGHEITVHSREASSYELLEDGSSFNPSKEFMALIRTYK